MKLQMNYKINTKEFHEVDDVYIGTKDLVYSKNSLETVVSLSEFNKIIIDGSVVFMDKDYFKGELKKMGSLNSGIYQ